MTHSSVSMNVVPSTGLFSLSLLLQVDKKWFDYQLKVITATSNNLLMVFEIIFSISLRQFPSIDFDMV